MAQSTRPPVGVRAEHGGLEQGGVDDALGHGAGRRQVGRTGHGAFQQLRCALAVTGQLAAQMLGDLGQRGDKRIVIGRVIGNFRADRPLASSSTVSFVEVSPSTRSG